MRRLLLVSVVMMFPAAGHAMDEQDLLFTSLNRGNFTSATLSISGSSGNRDSETYDLQINSTHRGKKTTWMVAGELRYFKTEGFKTDDREKAQARMIWHLSDVHGIEVFAQYERDVLERLSKHLQAGAGYRYELKANPDERLSYALGAGLTREQIRYTSSPREEQNSRANLYASVQARISAHNFSTLTFTSKLTPEVSDWSDWRGAAALTLRVPITKKLSASLQAEYDYDVEPAIGVERRNLQYSTGLTYSF